MKLSEMIENLQKFGVPVVVTLNAFVSDTDAEIAYIKEFCESRDCEFAIAKVWEQGGEGGVELAKKVLNTLETKESHYKPLYDLKEPIIKKIEIIAKEIYGADGVDFDSAAKKTIKELEALGYGELPICMAKTQFSFSDDPKLLGRPSGFRITVRDVYVSAGAGFIVALTGNVMTMPGLSKNPAAYNIDLSDDGKIVGLY